MSTFLAALSPYLQRGRRVGLGLALVGAICLFYFKTSPHYPWGQWLLLRYIGYWAAILAYALSSYGVGDRVIRLCLRGRTLPFTTHVPVASALGTLVFGVTVFVAGALYLLWWPTFFALPLGLAVAGGRRPYRLLWRGIRRMAPKAVPTLATRILRAPAWMVLGLGVIGMYIPALTPGNIGYDSLWYHLPIAEHYAAQHTIGVFREGWHPGVLPHFASYLYTWAFLLPSSTLFDHAELSLHIEFWSVVQVLLAFPAALRQLVGGWRPWAAAIVFLFPTMYLCDLHGGADHISALFVIPAWILLLRCFRRLEPGHCALFGMAAAAVLLTKLTGAPVFFSLMVGFGIRFVWRIVRGPSRPITGALVGLAAAGATLAPWWLRNAIVHHNPVYPNLSSLFTGSRPWHADSAFLFEEWARTNLKHPPRTLEGHLESLYQVFHFSFQTHDWDFYAGQTPVFGSLFTLTMLVLPLVRSNRRTWGLFAVGAACVFGWYSLHHEERYLLTPLPLFALAAGAALFQIWRDARVLRVLGVGLVACQLAWGADVYFLPSHHRFVQPLLDLMSGGFRKKYKSRLDVPTTFAGVDKQLPPDAKVLLHEYHVHFGFGRPSISDWVEWQSGLNYGRLGSTEAVWRRLREFGVTHVVWDPKSREGDSIAGELLFGALVTTHTTAPVNVGGFRLAKLIESPPPAHNDRVAFLGCGHLYQTGVYRLSSLLNPAIGPNQTYPGPERALSQNGPIPDDVDFVVQAPKCSKALIDASKFVQTSTRGELVLFARTAGKRSE